MSKICDKGYQYKRTNKETKEEMWLGLVIDDDNEIYSYVWTNDPDAADRFDTTETFYKVLEKYNISLKFVNFDTDKYHYELEYYEDVAIDDNNLEGGKIWVIQHIKSILE